MWQQVELALSQSAHRVLVKLAIFLPALVALVLALVILTAIGAGLAALLRRFLTAAKFDERLARNAIGALWTAPAKMRTCSSSTCTAISDVRITVTVCATDIEAFKRCRLIGLADSR